MSDTRGMLARLRKLERSRGAGDEMREWLAQAFYTTNAARSVACAPSMAMWCGTVS